MSHNWQGGCIDRQDPRAPISTPLASDITVVEGVQPPTQLLTEHFQMASQTSIAQALAEGASAAQDDWHHCSQPGSVQVAEADVSWPGVEVAAEPDVTFPEDPGVGVEWQQEAPRSPYALATGGAQAFEEFIYITDMCGCVCVCICVCVCVCLHVCVIV